MSTQKLITLCFATVFALGLAACGGGGGGDASVADTMDNGDTGDTGDTDDTMTSSPTVAGLFATAQDARDDATSAGTSASDAVKAAGEANEELGTMKAAGESMTEMTNAQAIMGAQADAVQAVMDAQAALDSANEAKTATEGLDGDNEHKSALIAALDAAIMVAEEQLEAATESRDSADLKAAVDAVTGGDDADPQGTPASRAKAVAMAVGAALGGMTTDAAIPRGMTDMEPDAADMNAVRMDDHQGMTWAELVGDRAMESRVGTVDAERTAVMIASIDGMTATDVHDTSFDGTYTDSQRITGANYMGIPGNAYCLSADCEVNDDGKLAKGWYFSPASPTAFYMKRTDMAGTPDVDESKLYGPETVYAQFGHWLGVDATTGVVTINRYALTGGNAANLEFDNVDGMPDSATYNGDAAGMSVHKTTDEHGAITSIYSGAFTADAELLLRFGDGADVTLGGTIDGFEGNAVDEERWTVELERRRFTDGEFTGDPATGKTVASGRNGVWSATAYGPEQVGGDDQRPTGIFGIFNAHFSDGHAAGAYATR